MGASATEPGRFTHCVHARQRGAVGSQHPAVEVCFQTTKSLAGQYVQPDRDQRATRSRAAVAGRLRIEQLVWCHHSHQSIAEEPACRRRSDYLRILAEPAAYLKIVRLDRLLQSLPVNEMLTNS